MRGRALAVRNYRLYAGGFLASSLSAQMMATAVAWEVYERTRDPLALGYVGLARALPVVVLALAAGQASDIYNRRSILITTQSSYVLLCAALAWASAVSAPLWILYLLLVLAGCTRAFNAPSRTSLLPLLVPAGTLQNAVTWNSNIFQMSAIAGPMLAGVLLDATGHAWTVYGAASAGALAFVLLLLPTRPAPQPRATGGITWSGMFEGARHIYRERTIWGAISLDLFAVLLGGATALLPIYASEILVLPGWLESGVALGALKAAPFIGALLMGLWLAHRPPFQRAGPVLLWSVVAFGIATIVFGLAQHFWLALVALAVGGAADNISVVIRHVLVQLRTPDHLRGRVSAVNAMFIECSNELGAFESGLVAKLISPVFSVVSGGVGTLLVVAGVAWRVPEVRRLRRVDEEPGKS